ncbi:MAG TPA: hypothetical protein VF107_02300 [Burkholderiaceae bacterium]
MKPNPRPRKRAPDAQPSDEVRVVREHTREPRLPHESDESADSQNKSAPDALGRKAFEDVEAGRVDTDRGPVLEELGRRLPTQGEPAPAKRRRAR